ncbi:MAG: class I SAM-dependent methyltransferase [Patescibacteria group bacterium]
MNQPNQPFKSLILTTEPSVDYELIDSGDGEKLERFGNVTLVRPDPQALWNKNSPENVWLNATARFVQDTRDSRWVFRDEATEKASKVSAGDDDWSIKIGALSFLLGFSSFKHTGIFPEQTPNWDWITETIRGANDRGGVAGDAASSSGKISVLNLFGYTGGATLAAASAGAEVCHVDASKVSIARAKKNAELSGLAQAPIRFILDDAMAFVKREARRGKKYDAIIMDPPAFGRGPDGEVWKIEKDLPKLIDACREILADQPLFVLINGYAAGYSPLAYLNILESLLPKTGSAGTTIKMETECGELTIRESMHGSSGGRLLSAGIFARSRRA